MLVVLDALLNRVTRNRMLGKYTHIITDELHIFFRSEYTANFFADSWKRFRKYGGILTGVTQNVTECLASPTACTLLSNSDFLLMLNQSAVDREKLAALLNISDSQLSYITNAEPGHGLLKINKSMIPFINAFPKNTELYKLMSTKPGEG